MFKSPAKKIRLSATWSTFAINTSHTAMVNVVEHKLQQKYWVRCLSIMRNSTTKLSNGSVTIVFGVHDGDLATRTETPLA